VIENGSILSTCRVYPSFSQLSSRFRAFLHWELKQKFDVTILIDKNSQIAYSYVVPRSVQCRFEYECRL